MATKQPDSLDLLLKRMGEPDQDSSEEEIDVSPVFSGRMITDTGASAYVKVGFSWTTLFFGAFVPLFRGDLKWFLIMLLSNWLIIPWLIWAVDYNRQYINSLLERGYYPDTPGLKAALIQNGFPL